jgi:hypothetical protein
MAKPEILLKTDKTALHLERLPDGKFRVNAASWDEPKVILVGQVLEVRVNNQQPWLIRRDRVADPAIDPVVRGFDYVSDE